MITPNALTRTGLISTSPTGLTTRFLANRDGRFVPREMNVFQQRFDQTAAPQDLTRVQSDKFGLAQLRDSSKNLVKNKLFQRLTDFKPPSLMLMSEFLPERDPVMDQVSDYFSGLYGLDNIGRIAKGDLMQGYNPISGGGLYTLTGGRLGQEPTIGLDRAYQKRIDTIRNVGIPRLLRAGKDPSNLQKRLNDLIARQAKDNAAVQLIKLANATPKQKQTISDFQAGNVNVGMPEQPTGGAGPNVPTQTFAAPTQQGQSPRGSMTTGLDIPDRGRNR
jgi:hypothetical protein